MAVSLKHTTQAVGTDAGNGEIRKAQWNEEHTLTAAANTILGAVSAGAVGEITCTAAGRALLDDADAAAQRTTLGLGTADSLTLTGLTLTGIGTLSAGSASAPSLIPSGDTNTGVWFPAADTMAVSTGGTERLRINSSGQVGLNVTPVAELDVNGNYATNIVAVSALDIDCSAGNYFTKTINANSTFTFSNPPASRSYSFTLELTHTSGTVTWPAAVAWPGGTTPSLTTGRTHLFMFVTDDGGTRWRGAGLTNYTT